MGIYIEPNQLFSFIESDLLCIPLGHIHLTFTSPKCSVFHLDTQPERATGQVNSPHGKAEWATDPWALRVKGLIVLVSPN